MITVHSLRLAIALPDTSQDCFHYPDFSIPSGCVGCLFGKNGSGKTTLGHFLFGLSDARVTRGTIDLGHVTFPAPKTPRLGDHGYRFLPQRPPRTGNLRTLDILHLLTRNIRQSREPAIDPSTESSRTAFEILKRVMNRHLSDLSGGEWKISLLIAYLSSSETHGLILDEPLAGLAPALQEVLLQLLLECSSRQNLSVLLTAVADEDRPKLSRAIEQSLVLNLGTIAQRPT